LRQVIKDSSHWFFLFRSIALCQPIRKTERHARALTGETGYFSDFSGTITDMFNEKILQFGKVLINVVCDVDLSQFQFERALINVCIHIFVIIIINHLLFFNK
jgi:hypothetical protein